MLRTVDFEIFRAKLDAAAQLSIYMANVPLQ